MQISAVPSRIRAVAFGLGVLMFAGSAGLALRAQQPTGADWCNDDRSNRERQFCEVREFTVPATAGVLSVRGTNGGIAVDGEARGDVHILAKVTANATSQDRAREIARAVVVNPTLERVEAEGPQGLGNREGWAVSYRLAAPRGLNVSLHTTNGGISIRDMESTMDFTTTNGGVNLTRVDGRVQGRTTNGGVNVRLDGPSWQGDGLDVQTTNGGVHLEVPENYSATLEARTNNGGMTFDVPGTVQRVNSRDVTMQLGSGGAPIKLQTSNGGVRVTRR